jgi:hypothetical protein
MIDAADIRKLLLFAIFVDTHVPNTLSMLSIVADTYCDFESCIPHGLVVGSLPGPVRLLEPALLQFITQRVLLQRRHCFIGSTSSMMRIRERAFS